MKRSVTPSSSNASIWPSSRGAALKVASSAYFRDTGFSSTFSTTLTMCCWVMPTTLPAAEQEVMVWTSGETTDLIEQIAILSGATTKYTNYHSGSNGTATSTATVAVDTWQFLAGVTYSASSRAVFVGTEKTTDTTLSTPLVNATYLTFGAAPWASYGANYTGLILMPMLWTRALHDSEIAAIRANPWQLLLPEPRTVYSFSVTAGTTDGVLGAAASTAAAAFVGASTAAAALAASGTAAMAAVGASTAAGVLAASGTASMAAVGAATAAGVLSASATASASFTSASLGTTDAVLGAASAVASAAFVGAATAAAALTASASVAAAFDSVTISARVREMMRAAGSSALKVSSSPASVGLEVQINAEP